MPYKTIIIELLRQQPWLHGRLRRQRKVLAVVNHYAGELKTRHEHWKAALPMSRPDMDQIQLASAALEIALAEVRQRLRNASLPDEKNPSSSGAARARSRKRTSRD